MKIFLLGLCLISFSFLSSCGIKGPLYLPEDEEINELKTF
ncbi:lipoprotein [Gammaproteobacteria bacterium]|jgi:predicted small lipoprotein YifL|nr:lipoprotein [Gammaproteobacteria bacterium]